MCNCMQEFLDKAATKLLTELQQAYSPEDFYEYNLAGFNGDSVHINIEYSGKRDITLGVNMPIKYCPFCKEELHP